MNVQCRSRLESDGDRLSSHEIKAWISDIPDGASIAAITKDFGSQRDPDPRLVGLAASWSEDR